jgi:hypothetical protein
VSNRVARILIAWALGVIALGISRNYGAASSSQGKVWKTSGFLGFIDGTLSDGGANTYIAADGTIRLINLWDLNGDGNLDVVFPSTHDNHEKLPLSIYWNKRGFSPNQRTELPTDGGKAVAIADLNKDGHPDLIVANNFNGTKTDLASYIYWGGPSGFDPNHRTELPTQGAEAVTVADLNGDGYPEIIFANSGVTYHMVEDRTNQSYIYWGSKEGYAKDRRTSLRTVYARDVKVSDLNRDGIPDIVFADEGNTSADSGALIFWGSPGGHYSDDHSVLLPGIMSAAVELADLDGNGYPEIILANPSRLRARELNIYNVIETVFLNSYVYWGSSEGFSATRRTELPTVGASCAAVGDLNGDGRPDILFGNSAGGAAYIYWADEDGFHSNKRTAIPTQNVSKCAIEDVNRDGFPDLIFANNDDGRTHNTQSYIYWGNAEGFSKARRTELPTLGATGLGIADLDADGAKDLVFVNKQDGTAGGPTDSYIYWGDNQGQFSANRRQSLPTLSANSYAAADLNNDGYVDLFLPESTNATIYWGSQKGYSAEKKTFVAPVNAMSARVADFNRDGYLDIFLAQFKPGGDENSIYFGGPAGFSAANRFVIHAKDVRFPAVADLNHDNWPDLILPTTTGQVVVYWNSPQGFDNARRTILPCAAAVSANVADLNGDGYLDIMVGNLFDPNPAPGKPRTFGGSPEGDTYIYWGSARGYSETNRLVLPSVGTHCVVAADLNGDGLLDLVLSSYHAGTTRSHPSYIYWNSPKGFDPQKVTMLPTNSASGVIVDDFNHDGYKDILFVCHSKDGNHRTDSFLYWGSADGYSVERRSLIPGVGVHMVSTVDIGNIYDRSDHYDYISPPFEGGPGARFTKIDWEGETPFRTRLEFQIRSANTRDGLASAAWVGPQGPNSYYTKSGSTLVGEPAMGRWLQYKARLISLDSADTPILQSVSISYQ